MGTELEGRVALVTGATSGIGRATALRFAEAGARVAIVGRNAQALKEVAGEIEMAGGESLSIRADVTVQPIARRVVAQTVERFGGLDVLVNAAGHL
nr:SDR family NAD(P)-dependent oxidoreductase [Acidobacteriota bacterium]